MDSPSTGKSAAPVLCARGCGFFGNPACSSMCSKCYREHTALAEKEAEQLKTVESAAPSMAAVVVPSMTTSPDCDGQAMDVEPAPEATPSVPAASPVAAAVASAPISIPAPAATASPPRALAFSEPGLSAEASGAEPGTSAGAEAKPSNRCASCSKKVGLTGFKCRCLGVFCATHRYSDKHECTFDYKAAGREAIAKANPTVIASKVDKF